MERSDPARKSCPSESRGLQRIDQDERETTQSFLVRNLFGQPRSAPIRIADKELAKLYLKGSGLSAPQRIRQSQPLPRPLKMYPSPAEPCRKTDSANRSNTCFFLRSLGPGTFVPLPTANRFRSLRNGRLAVLARLGRLLLPAQRTSQTTQPLLKSIQPRLTAQILDVMPLIDRIMPAAQQTTKINIANLAEGTSLADVMTSFSQFGKIMRCSLKQHYDGQDTSVLLYG
ncbi:hypothetical protein PGTUg99_006667 [Puccinia graminis f. sp. tritici]|uniref:Uncharacterized protein n=1 Tax=Puccinia graminis f. sp. tritici TaxID=56615 RepID=A0A5B0SDZ9_PUCGR|nr:hypothetical protein PGTUg99_006667 [Puccinia graminis f. sp. tritici]